VDPTEAREEEAEEEEEEEEETGIGSLDCLADSICCNCWFLVCLRPSVSKGPCLHVADGVTVGRLLE
jgi:hypothetical protein